MFTSVHSSRGDGARAAVKDEGDERGVTCSHLFTAAEAMALELL